MKKRAFVTALCAGILCLCGASAFGWEADFEPSTFNPPVAETVEFAICEPCLDSGIFTYAWDFDGDGVIDLDTGEPTAEYAFEAEGFYVAEVTLKDADGRRKTARKGILVGDVPAYAVRERIAQGDGTVFVLITIYVNESVTAPGIQESMPRGWQVELLDDGGAMAAVPNPENRTYDVLYATVLDPGDERSFSYRLHPAGATDPAELTGILSGHTDGSRFALEICGVLEGVP